jgi:hypothetical protein
MRRIGKFFSSLSRLFGYKEEKREEIPVEFEEDSEPEEDDTTVTVEPSEQQYVDPSEKYEIIYEDNDDVEVVEGDDLIVETDTNKSNSENLCASCKDEIIKAIKDMKDSILNMFSPIVAHAAEAQQQVPQQVQIQPTEQPIQQEQYDEKDLTYIPPWVKDAQIPQEQLQELLNKSNDTNNSATPLVPEWSLMSDIVKHTVATDNNQPVQPPMATTITPPANYSIMNIDGHPIELSSEFMTFLQNPRFSKDVPMDSAYSVIPNYVKTENDSKYAIDINTATQEMLSLLWDTVLNPNIDSTTAQNSMEALLNYIANYPVATVIVVTTIFGWRRLMVDELTREANANNLILFNTTMYQKTNDIIQYISTLSRT